MLSYCLLVKPWEWWHLLLMMKNCSCRWLRPFTPTLPLYNKHNDCRWFITAQCMDFSSVLSLTSCTNIQSSTHKHTLGTKLMTRSDSESPAKGRWEDTVVSFEWWAIILREIKLHWHLLIKDQSWVGGKDVSADFMFLWKDKVLHTKALSGIWTILI